MLDSLWQRFPDNIFLIRCEEDGRFIVEAINPALERVMKMSNQAVAGRPIEEIVPFDYLDAVCTRYRECARTAAPLSYEETGGGPGEEPRHWLTLMVPATDLSGRVEYILGISREITAIRRAEALLRQTNEELERRVQERTAALETANHRLQELATTDYLTGFRNRRHFFELAERELALSRRSGRPLSLLMLDMDHFKDINDSLGHAAGDHVLRAIGTVFRATFRETDVIGRYGGEEFAVLLLETQPSEVCTIADRLRMEVSRCEVGFHANTIRCTLSVGVAHFDPERDLTLDDFLDRADMALLRAKTDGRNRLVVGL